jgi:hypothetical protein
VGSKSLPGIARRLVAPLLLVQSLVNQRLVHLSELATRSGSV